MTRMKASKGRVRVMLEENESGIYTDSNKKTKSSLLFPEKKKTWIHVVSFVGASLTCS